MVSMKAATSPRSFSRLLGHALAWLGKAVAAAAAVVITLVAILLLVMWREHRTGITLPAPNGPFAVGRASFAWTNEAETRRTRAVSRVEAAGVGVGMVPGGPFPCRRTGRIFTRSLASGAGGASGPVHAIFLQAGPSAGAHPQCVRRDDLPRTAHISGCSAQSQR